MLCLGRAFLYICYINQKGVNTVIIGTVTTIVVGVICIILGIVNMRGNISSIHTYHRYRVSDKDVPIFGKLVGLGTVIIGVGIIAMSVFLFLSELFKNEAISFIGMGLMAIGFIVGISISFYAMKKYNGRIF